MSEVSFHSPTRALARLLVYLTFTLALIPVQALLVALRTPLSKRFPTWYHQRCLGLLGLKIVTHGETAEASPVLFACNHVSYLDITILGATLKRASFVAKSDVADWPLFGTLAKLQRTVFVDRAARRQTSVQRDEMTRRLEQGDDLILFPEGTSGDGNHVLPFKSALFSVAEKRPHDRPLTVQPVSITYTKLDNQPMGRYLRPFVAWYGDMDMASHIWTVAGLGTITAELTFHPPVTIDQFASRKEMARYCRDKVALGVAEMLSGRADHLPTAGDPDDPDLDGDPDDEDQEAAE